MERSAHKWAHNSQVRCCALWEASMPLAMSVKQPLVERSAHKLAQMHPTHQQLECQPPHQLCTVCSSKPASSCQELCYQAACAKVCLHLGAQSACVLQGEQWEERWGEHYRRRGQASKWADKWSQVGNQVLLLARHVQYTWQAFRPGPHTCGSQIHAASCTCPTPSAGAAMCPQSCTVIQASHADGHKVLMQIWHEKWGEEYDGPDGNGPGGCMKYTDKACPAC